MKNHFIMFECPDIAQKMRESGFVVLLQQINGKQLYVTEDIPLARDFFLKNYADQRIMFSDRLYF